MCLDTGNLKEKENQLPQRQWNILKREPKINNSRWKQKNVSWDLFDSLWFEIYWAASILNQYKYACALNQLKWCLTTEAEYEKAKSVLVEGW